MPRTDAPCFRSLLLAGLLCAACLEGGSVETPVALSQPPPVSPDPGADVEPEPTPTPTPTSTPTSTPEATPSPAPGQVAKGLGRAPTEEEKKLWGEFCSPGEISDDLSADLRAQMQMYSLECRQLVAARAERDTEATNAMARCAIKLRADKPKGNPKQLMQDCLGPDMFERMNVADATRDKTPAEIMQAKFSN